MPIVDDEIEEDEADDQHAENALVITFVALVPEPICNYSRFSKRFRIECPSGNSKQMQINTSMETRRSDVSDGGKAPLSTM